MKNLLPREAYDQDETGYWKRLPILLGTAFGFIFALLMYFGEEGQPDLRDLLLLRLEENRADQAVPHSSRSEG